MAPSKVHEISFTSFDNIVDGKPRSAKNFHQGINPVTTRINTLRPPRHSAEKWMIEMATVLQAQTVLQNPYSSIPLIQSSETITIPASFASVKEAWQHLQVRGRGVRVPVPQPLGRQCRYRLPQLLRHGRHENRSHQVGRAHQGWRAAGWAGRRDEICEEQLPGWAAPGWL